MTKVYFGELSHVQALHALAQNSEPTLSGLLGSKHACPAKEKTREMRVLALAGEAGFEPTHTGTRNQRLTTWPLPNVEP
jgi:hypothetical protein